MRVALSIHDDMLSAAAADSGGYVFSTAGDSIGVAFGRVAGAVEWARAVQQRLANASWPEEVALRVRIGMYTGEADERGGDDFGPAVGTM